VVEVVEGLGKTVIAISRGAVAQLGERGLCKPEVVGSIPISSTRNDFFATHAETGVAVSFVDSPLEGGRPGTGRCRKCA
jgi:hypothetical protein